MDKEIYCGSVPVSYFDPFDLFESLRPEFQQILPLDNIHWKAFDGTVRTVNRLPIELIPEGRGEADKSNDEQPFIRFLIVNCISIDQYRTKVRPLVRQWLPNLESVSSSTGEKMIYKPIILLYANSEVVDSNLFKSVSLMEKFGKDFPHVQTLEVRSVYRSPKERQEFWNQFSQKIKASVLSIFQKRLTHLQHSLANLQKGNNFEEQLLTREKLYELYVVFNILEDASLELQKIKKEILRRNMNMPDGKLQVPFESSSKSDESLGSIIIEGTLDKFQLHKYFFIRRLRLLKLEDQTLTAFVGAFQLIKNFIESISIEYRKSVRLLEFKHYFITSMLSYFEFENVSNPLLCEIKAELLMLKRDNWVQGVMATSGYRLMDKNYPNSDVKYKFDLLKETFVDETVFQENFLTLTKEILSLFNKCEGKRQRIVDILSIEIGLLYYQGKKYEEAVSLFLSCYEYYTQTNWNSIGLKILQVFIDSLSHCPKLDVLQIDGESVSASAVLTNAFLNILKLCKDNDSKEIWWKKFMDLQMKNNIHLMYPLDGLFEVTLNSKVHLARANVSAIEVNLKSYGFPEDISTKTMRLSLKNMGGDVIVFEASDFLLKKGENKLILECRDIMYGEFSLLSFEIIVEGITFVKEFPENQDEFIVVPEIYCKESTKVLVKQAHNLNLGEYALELKSVQSDALESLQVEVEVQKNIGNMKNLPVSFSMDEIQARKRYNTPFENVRLEYYLLDQITAFDLIIKTSFTKKNDQGTFGETKKVRIQCYLQLSVSVEDIFKKDIFFFKFLLNSSVREEPVILYSSELSAPDTRNDYNIRGDYIATTPALITFDGNESFINCYEITANNNFDSKDIFNLKVRYNTLKEQLDCFITDAVLIEGDVEWFILFEKWKTFWELEILKKLKYDYDAFKENRIIRLLKTSIDLNKTKSKIRNLCIEKAVLDKILICLNKVSRGIAVCNTDMDEYVRNLVPKQLTVPVQLPGFEQFFHVQFEQMETSHDALHDTIATIGNSLSYTVIVENLSGQWGQDVIDDGGYIFEILSSNEWLIHGQKRCAIKEKRKEFEVHLIPLKKGYLNFPRVEITNINGKSCRVDHSNAFESILIF
ncbi:Trs130p [Saccharomyces cerevisiae P283]|nr:Trs130p [Saccharomyces cerevisiae YJM1244]EWH16809.1 Trs130p [Saccharomyces cerevisiae P283]CAI4736263.1 AGA_1a_G0044340.mRNA.1.CDS.1 [Saccharomyces cerevisiae]CAI6855800.1 AGA_1a_G0044340.mRNA.1.CDS.1 [Saccharomyces cerevisiae]